MKHIEINKPDEADELVLVFRTDGYKVSKTQLQSLLNYMRENNLSLAQLIEQHSYWAKMAHDLHKEAIEKAAGK